MADGPRIPQPCDPWRKRMRHTAEALRRIDGVRFQAEIARIEECLRVDADWNLEAALATARRPYAPLPAVIR